jgi:hypothetical protein
VIAEQALASLTNAEAASNSTGEDSFHSARLCFLAIGTGYEFRYDCQP